MVKQSHFQVLQDRYLNVNTIKKLNKDLIQLLSDTCVYSLTLYYGLGLSYFNLHTAVWMEAGGLAGLTVVTASLWPWPPSVTGAWHTCITLPCIMTIERF